MRLQEHAIKEIKDIVSQFINEPTPLMMILSAVQTKFGYIPMEAQELISEETGISVAEIYGVVTFYSFFSLEPKGKYIIRCCDGTACHVRGSQPILDQLYEELNLSSTKHTTDDLTFTVETVSCLGACGLAPTVMVNEDVHPKMTPEKVYELIDELRKG